MCEQGQERWLTTDTEVLFVETSICVLRRVTSCPGLPGLRGSRDEVFSVLKVGKSWTN